MVKIPSRLLEHLCGIRKELCPEIAKPPLLIEEKEKTHIFSKGNFLPGQAKDLL